MRAAAGRVRHMVRAAYLEVCRELLAVKGQMEHGQFIAWVETECGMSIRTFERVMVAAEMVAENDKLSYLPQEGLLAFSPPEIFREEIDVLGQPVAGWHEMSRRVT
jgi:hypothetical protein